MLGRRTARWTFSTVSKNEAGTFRPASVSSLPASVRPGPSPSGAAVADIRLAEVGLRERSRLSRCGQDPLVEGESVVGHDLGAVVPLDAVAGLIAEGDSFVWRMQEAG